MSTGHATRRHQLVLHIIHRRQQRCKAIEAEERAPIDDRVRQIYIYLAHLWSNVRQLEEILDNCNQQVEAATVQFMLWRGIRIGEDL